MCYCEHCRQNFRAASGLDLPRTDDPQDPARRAVHRLAPAAPLRALAALGRRDPEDQSRRARFIPNAGGGALSELDMKTIGELAPTLFADRQARQRPHAALGQRQERQGVPRHDGPQADRRHLQRGRRGAVPLEGLGAERRRDPALGRSTASPTACGRGSPSSPASCTTAAGCRSSRTSTTGTTATSATCGTRQPLARVGAGLLAADGRILRRRAGARRRSRTTRSGIYQALVEARIPFEMVHDRLLDAAHIEQFKTLILPNIAALSDAAVRAAPRVRRARRRPRRHLRDVALRRVGRAARGLRAGRPLRRVVRRRGRRARCRTRTCSSRRIRDRQCHPLLARPGGRRRASSTACTRVHTRTTARIPASAADADPVLSRPADGGGLPARAEDRHPRGLRCARRARAASSTSPGTSTARSGKCSAIDHGKLLRNAVAWAHERRRRR